MKKQLTIYLITFLIAGLFVPQQIKAQSPPQKMSYQAILRDSNNALITSTQVGMQISILQVDAMGNSAPVYVETQTPTTNINGLVSLEVGTGTVILGTFSAINWANGPFYIKIETDPAGGTSYSITGTSQLLSVPYAFYAKTSGASNSWLLNGNANTVDDGTYFIGTTDNIPFNIKVNNQKAGRIDHLKNNSFYGYLSGDAITTGITNSAFGYGTLQKNTTGFENTAIGGHALYSNTIGQQNTATGAFALQFNTTGSVNTATGEGALNLNTVGSYNSAFGFQTLSSNTSGTHNIASGYLSMWSNTTGNQNTAYGSYALNSNTIGNLNTAVGYLALKNTTGSNGNTALGDNAGNNSINNGNNNTFIGYNAAADNNGYTNTTALGYGAITTLSNTIQLGNANVINVNTAGTYTAGAVTYLNTDGTSGQVLTTNGAGATSWASVAGSIGGFTHYLGEDFNGGIIYYLYKGSDGLEHGLIVSKTESTAVWQVTPTTTNADRTEDGTYNTGLMTGSAAATYIGTLGSGWYLPSIDELNLLYFNRYTAQKGLRAGGFTLLSASADYWSSTEYDVNNAFYFTFGFAGQVSNKNNSHTVRGVRAF